MSELELRRNGSTHIVYLRAGETMQQAFDRLERAAIQWERAQRKYQS